MPRVKRARTGDTEVPPTRKNQQHPELLVSSKNSSYKPYWQRVTVDSEGNDQFEDVEEGSAGARCFFAFAHLDEHDNVTATFTKVELMRMCDLNESESRECPIAQEEFNKVQMVHAKVVIPVQGKPVKDWLPKDNLFYEKDETFIPNLPQHCIARICSCKHTFSVLNLVHHFSMSGMLCPLCRGGFNMHSLRIQCLPSAVRVVVFNNVYVSDLIHRSEQEEQEMADEEIARLLGEELASAVESQNVNATVYLLGSSSGATSHEFSLPRISPGIYVMMSNNLEQLRNTLSTSGAESMRVLMNSQTHGTTNLPEVQLRSQSHESDIISYFNRDGLRIQMRAVDDDVTELSSSTNAQEEGTRIFQSNIRRMMRFELRVRQQLR